VTQPTPHPLTPQETRLAEALATLVDYTGRVLLTALAGTSPHYLGEKARSLADAATRVADLAQATPTRAAGRHAGQPGMLRLPAVARAAAAWSQAHPAGRALFPHTPRARTGR
jgi:hypothetical protein